MILDARFTVASRGVDMALHAEEGETVVLLGPNGAGKSTALAVLAGLVEPDSSRILLETTLLSHRGGSARRVWVPPHERGVGLLGQDPLLFPHLTVLENVAFPLRSGGTGKTAARARAEQWLERVGAIALRGRSAERLSGGQAQRVALARALAADPRVLLLDEPLSALDVSAAPALRALLAEVLRDRTAIVVSHDVLDALVLGDRVVVLAEGRVAESGPVEEVLEQPTTAFTARMTGQGLLFGTSVSEGVRLDEGTLLRGLGPGREASCRTAVLVPPGRVGLEVRDPGGVPGCTVLEVAVTGVEARGDSVRVHLGVLTAELPAARAARLPLAVGAPLWAVLPHDALRVYPLRGADGPARDPGTAGTGAARES